MPVKTIAEVFRSCRVHHCSHRYFPVADTNWLLFADRQLHLVISCLKGLSLSFRLCLETHTRRSTSYFTVAIEAKTLDISKHNMEVKEVLDNRSKSKVITSDRTCPHSI
jgi:hypothetical protein